jgi:hypothetical protein
MPPPLRLIPGGLAAPTPADVARFVPRTVTPPEEDVPPFVAQVPPSLARPIPSEPLGFDPASPLGMDIGGNAPPATSTLSPRFLMAPSAAPSATAAPPAPAEFTIGAPLAHGDTMPDPLRQRGSAFYIPDMPPMDAAAPIATPAQTAAAVQAAGMDRPERGPRLLGSPRASAQAAAPAEPPDFIDQLTSYQGQLWQEPQETPYDRERRALAAATQLEQQRQEMLGAQAMERADVEEAYRRQQAEHELARRQAEGNARASVQRASDRLAAMRVDPSRYYRNAGAVGMLGNAIAVGLGAMGEALGGGPNIAVQQINAAVDRDIAAQERDISTASEDVQNRRGILADVQREMLTRQGAIEATRAIMLRDLAAQAEAQAATHGSAEATARAAALRDQLLTAQEQALAAAQAHEVEAALELRMQLARLRSAEARAARDERRAMGGGGTAAQRVTAPEMQAFDAMAASAPELASTPEGRAQIARMAGLPEGFVPSGNPITTDARGGLDAFDAAIREVESLIPSQGDIEGAGIVDNAIPTWIQSDAGLELRGAIENLIDLLGRTRSGAAITEDERVAFRNMLIGSGTERELRSGIARLRREVAARLGRSGARSGGTQMLDLASAEMRRVE